MVDQKEMFPGVVCPSLDGSHLNVTITQFIVGSI